LQPKTLCFSKTKALNLTFGTSTERALGHLVWFWQNGRFQG
jgi:hypothetical protein